MRSNPMLPKAKAWRVCSTVTSASASGAPSARRTVRVAVAVRWRIEGAAGLGVTGHLRVGRAWAPGGAAHGAVGDGRSGARARRRGACDELGGEPDVAARLAGAVEEADEQAERRGPHLAHGLGDRRERRTGERGLRDVVEADDRQLVRHRDTELPGDVHGPDRREVVRREDRRRPLLQGEELARRHVGTLPAVVTAPHEVRVRGDAGGLERGTVALLAQAGGLEVGAAAEEPDAAVPEGEEVVGGGERA